MVPGVEGAGAFADPFFALLFVGLCIAVVAGMAHWGPGLHIHMATKLLAGKDYRLKAPQIRLLKAYPHDFLYGNMAADIINFKMYGGLKNHCHHWNMKERIEAIIDAEHEFAFLYGYLCHLAADVVAHNHFVPFHILYGMPPKILGHTYWEARADGAAEPQNWDIIDELRSRRELHQSDRVINLAVRKKMLSLNTNKWIFNNILLARSRKSWRGIMATMSKRKPRGTIHQDEFKLCLDQALENMYRVFDDQGFVELMGHDPNGHAALRRARTLRTRLIAKHRTRAAAAEDAREQALESFGLADAP